MPGTIVALVLLALALCMVTLRGRPRDIALTLTGIGLCALGFPGSQSCDGSLSILLIFAGALCLGVELTLLMLASYRPKAQAWRWIGVTVLSVALAAGLTFTLLLVGFAQEDSWYICS